MKFQEDLELRKRAFEKMGWSFIPERERWCQGNGPIDSPVKGDDPNALPPIETSWEVCAERLALFMKGKGWTYTIENHDLKKAGWKMYFVWWDYAGINGWEKKEIINDNIARAACEAFLEVEL